MPVTDIFHIRSIKAELEQTRQERDSLRSILSETERLDLHEIQQAIARLQEQKVSVESDLEEQRERVSRDIEQLQANADRTKQSLDEQIAELNQQIAARKSDLIVLDEELLLQSFGFYKPRYDLQNSELYRDRLDQVRLKQAAMVKSGKAALCPTDWTVSNSKVEGQRMVRDYTKLILRSFNNECNASVTNVKFSNIDAIEKKIRKAFETLNNLGRRMTVTIVPEYLNLKLEELYLCHEYQVKKQQEKEEQRRIRDEMREEAKLLKEIEQAKLKLAKEEKHFALALADISCRLVTASTDAERSALAHEKASLEAQVAELEKTKLDVLNREQNTRAGYVYIISNVGAFGENVYKIGVTRRLEPEERVHELGDASVPFSFDVHAMIFSDDAPGLEYNLHRAFEHRRLNLVNTRREFFKVTLPEIEAVVRENFNNPVEFTHLADAAEYRQSMALREARV
ncbi:MAG: DUF4041 domain-containing protein [Anaerolineae bacterium]|nr:DUF4041 domain-containing protein [Anaerolineae bacterium]